MCRAPAHEQSNGCPNTTRSPKLIARPIALPQVLAGVARRLFAIVSPCLRHRLLPNSGCLCALAFVLSLVVGGFCCAWQLRCAMACEMALHASRVECGGELSGIRVAIWCSVVLFPTSCACTLPFMCMYMCSLLHMPRLCAQLVIQSQFPLASDGAPRGIATLTGTLSALCTILRLLLIHAIF